ncbi:MAG: H-X9-DG-CTERM domain-containing protein, partial [Planctomycetota bacterium]|nr:H-X9-DG-CTERM domain-containing protein [Planctomycetota bacterium]
LRWPINSDTKELCYVCPSGTPVCLFNDLFFGSNHPGGAHFSLADGSVRFFDEAMDLEMLKDLATIAGGEVVEEE